MAEVRWNEVESIIDQALDLPEAERNGFIEQQCDGNQALKSEVTLLLDSIAHSEGWLENPGEYQDVLCQDIATDLNQLEGPFSLIGQSVGAYSITKEIGSGGMGTVYLAERADGAFEHQVALKVIRSSQANQENIQRFELERNILANLNHPGIAKLLDGGITEDGFPYLIMEYINGIPITRYCKERQLSLGQRLNLIKKVLAALRHAHENAVIHRDLKPDNILVTEQEEIKILDFGISKWLTEDHNTGLTQTHSRLMTPRYAAPEQIRQKSVTTATDLYGMGVLMYQLLCGNHPFQLEGLTQYEIEQTILNKQPSLPSSKITGSFPVGRHQVRGELDAITLKALCKTPERRYRMANELLEDLEKYQQGLPVSAHKDTYGYRCRKYIYRYRKHLGIASGILVILTAMTAFYTLSLTEERNLARVEAEKAEAITNFLVDLFKANDPNISQGDTLTARHLLAKGEQRLQELEGQPAIQSKVMEELGNIYRVISMPEKADSLQQRALSLKKKLYVAGDSELASIYSSLAATRQVLGKYQNALLLLDTALTYERDIYGPNSTEVARSLRQKAENLKEMGKLDDAYRSILSAQRLYQHKGDTLQTPYLKTLMELGSITVAQGKLQQSKQIWQHSLGLSNRLFDSPHPQIVKNINGLANVLKELEEFKQAEFLYRQSMDMTRKVYGTHHLNTAVTMNNLAGLYYYTEQYGQADNLYSESYDIFKNILGSQHPHVASILYNQANLRADMGDLEGARQLYHQVLELDIAQFGSVHPNVASDYTGLAVLYKKEHKLDSALHYFKKSLEIRRAVYEEEFHPYVLYNERSMAEILVEQEKYDQAKKQYQSLLTAYMKTFGDDHPKAVEVATDYALLLNKTGSSITADSLLSLHRAP